MEQTNEKQLIYFKDLVFSALYQWKKILVFGILFALLFGAFSILTTDETVSVGGVSMTPETQSKVDALNERLERYDALIESQRHYADNSPYMQIDPYASYTSGFHLHVTPHYDSPDTESARITLDSNMLLRSYRSLVTSSVVFDKISTLTGIEAAFLRDLVVYDGSNDGVLSITVYGRTLEEAQSISENLMAAVNSEKDAISQEIIAHDTHMVATQNGPTINTGIADAQAAVYKKLTTYESERLSVKTELNRYLPTEIVPGDSNPILLAIIGGILGAFLTVCYACVKHLGSSKIYSSRLLVNRTGIRVIGCVQDSRKRNFIDRWLRKLEGRASNKAFDAVAADIRNRCGEAKQLLIMGRFQPEALAPVTTLLEQAGICCTLCADPDEKADAINALPGSDAVVLAEVCGSSRYDQVEWAMQTVSDYGKSLLGCVLIDG